MTTIEGKIEKIATEKTHLREKKVVTLKMGTCNTVFVEFQGKSISWLDSYNEGDRVQMRIRFNGKVSSLGRKYNNIIAKSIKTV